MGTSSKFGRPRPKRQRYNRIPNKMETGKLAIIITPTGILTLIFLSQTKPIQTATIKSIQTSGSKTTIQLENHSTELIIFHTIPQLSTSAQETK